MLTIPVPIVYNIIEQAAISKSIVPDPRYFNGDKMKFEDY